MVAMKVLILYDLKLDHSGQDKSTVHFSFCP